MDIKSNIALVMEKVEKAAIKSGRRLEDITVVAVTKTQNIEAINQAIDAGLTVAGENRVQEFLEKWGNSKEVDWHLIGHLQTNKVKYIIDKVSLIHSVDSEKLLFEIDNQARKSNINVKVLLQVNISREESKFGLTSEKVYELARKCHELTNTTIEGLMTVAPFTQNPKDNMLHFCNLYKIYIDIMNKSYDNVNMRCLSMGMSSDYEQAIECGANIVRIGSAIFGKRTY